MDRTAAVRVLASAPAWKVPVVAMATPVDPILTAIERDRIAHVAFAASLNKTDGRKAAQEKGPEVAHTDEDAREAASAGWGDAVGESRDDGVWRQLGTLSSPLADVSSFRGLPQKMAAPNAELSRLRLAKPPPSKSGSLARI